MVTSLVKLLLAFPGLFKIFIQIREEIEKQVATDQHQRNRDLIAQWMRYDTKKPGT
jgi:hypothetical protein